MYLFIYNVNNVYTIIILLPCLYVMCVKGDCFDMLAMDFSWPMKLNKV